MDIEKKNNAMFKCFRYPTVITVISLKNVFHPITRPTLHKNAARLKVKTCGSKTDLSLSYTYDKGSIASRRHNANQIQLKVHV